MADPEGGEAWALPPLPEAIAADEPADLPGEVPAPRAPAAVGGGRRLEAGGWCVRLQAVGEEEALVGPLRVTRDADGRVRASGDLYATPRDGPDASPAAAALDPHPRASHREYLRVTQLTARGGGELEARVETYRVGAGHRWVPARRLTARLRPDDPAAVAAGAPAGRPADGSAAADPAARPAAASPAADPAARNEAASPAADPAASAAVPPASPARPFGLGSVDGEGQPPPLAEPFAVAARRWSGDARDPAGSPAGRLSLDWASPFLRRAVLEVDCEPGATVPRGNGAGVGWADAFKAAGWELVVVEDDPAVPPPPSGTWSDAEVHAAMLANRSRDDLDGEWRYHLLCVRRLASTDRGLMYDAFASDSNNVPREGLALASDWTFPDAEPWGRVRGLRFGDEPRTYFRTAVHELGHAMGLLHNPADDGYMSTTTFIARRAAAGAFPDNVRWAFAADDALRLAHLPDPCVRPGGLPFVDGATADAEDAAPPAGAGLELSVAPLAAAFPLGAPVRVEVALAHRGGGEPHLVPRRLGLKGGHVRGRVVGPDGATRRFLPLLRCTDDDGLAPLAPGEERRHGLALLRGPDGALFPAPGDYRVEVELGWAPDERRRRLAAATAVRVEPPPDAETARVAGDLLATPDLLLTVALGGDHLAEGCRALARALADPVLRPHFAAIEARRLAGRGTRAARRRAAALCREATVIAGSERRKLERLLADGLFRRLATLVRRALRRR
jgi:hypothetical protein